MTRALRMAGASTARPSERTTKRFIFLLKPTPARLAACSVRRSKRFTAQLVLLRLRFRPRWQVVLSFPYLPLTTMRSRHLAAILLTVFLSLLRLAPTAHSRIQVSGNLTTANNPTRGCDPLLTHSDPKAVREPVCRT